MEPGPIPPHERSWRHPSELAAEQRAVLVGESTPRTTRILAFATGAAGLLAIGAVMVTITPRGVEAPVAIASTTTISAQAAVVPPSADSSAGSQAPLGLRSDSRPAREVSIAAVLATPIGDGQFALVTRASLHGASSSVIDVRLPSGRRSTAGIVTASDHAVVVALLNGETGHPVARRTPRASDMVTVLASPPVTVRFGDVALLDVAEGTAVLDSDAALVGLCSQGPDGKLHLIEVEEALDDATSVVP